MVAKGANRQSPLQLQKPSPIDPELFAMREIPFTTKINIRGHTEHQTWQQIFYQQCAMSVPYDSNQLIHHGDGSYVFWLGPNEWLLSAPATQRSQWLSALQQASDNAKSRQSFCSITDVSESRTVIEVKGRYVIETLNKGCPLNFDDQYFSAHTVAQSYLGHAFVLYHRLGDGETPIYHLYVLNSFAAYVWDYLADAAMEWQAKASLASALQK